MTGADTPADAEQLRAAFEPMQDAVKAITDLFEAVARQLAELAAELHAAGLLDDDGRPAAPRDRPAWQSPHGPAQPIRRH